MREKIESNCIHGMLYCLVLYHSDKARVILEEGILVEKMPLLHLACGQACGAFSCLVIGVGPGSLWAVPSLGSWSRVLEESRLTKSVGASQEAAPLHGLCISSCLQVPALLAFLP